MPGYFVDTSALAKLYHPEIGSVWMESLIRTHGARLIISQLSLIEIQSVCRGKVESSGCARVPEQMPPFPLVGRVSHRIAAGSCQGRTGFVRRRGAFTGGRDAT